MSTDIVDIDPIAEPAGAATEPEAAEAAETPETPEEPAGADAVPSRRFRRPGGLLLILLVPVIAAAVGWLKWWDGSARLAPAAATESVRAATDGAIAMLSYRPETVDADLTTAAGRLTGPFRDQYIQLVTDVVAPGAKQRHIAAAATVPAAGSVSATARHAVVLVFVNQTTTIGNDPPTASSSSVRVTLDKVDDRWLISQFDPV